MQIQGIEPAQIVDALHYFAPDTPNFLRVGNTEAIKEHLIIWNAGRNAQQLTIKLRTQSIRITGNGLEKLERFFKTASDKRRECIEIDDIVQDGDIALVMETQGGKYFERFPGPTQIGIAKPIERNISMLENIYCLLRLLKLLLFI